MNDGAFMWYPIVFSEFCDNFDRANSSTVNGWTEHVGDWTINSNMLQSENNSIWQYITRDGSSKTDGCLTARAIYSSGSGVKSAGLLARFSSTLSCVMAKIQDNTICGYFDSYFIYCNGGLITYETGLNFGTDAIIQMSFSGGNVVFRIDTNRDGIYDHSYNVTVTNLAAGLCGIFAYNQCYFDNWCYGATCP
jgi:hypothetical protein